jgi:hypothetical protein
MTVEPWLFATLPIRARDPQVALFAFGTGPLGSEIDLASEADRFGAPSPEAVRTCSVQTIARRQDPAWFDGFRSGSLRAIATQDLGAGTAALDAADHVHVIACQPRAVKDLTYLQAAWAFARCLAVRGAAIVFDAMAMAFTPADHLQGANEPLDIRREVRVVYETSTTRPDLAHALHTRGLRKFGAPDLIALCTDADVPLVGQAISELADAVARGTDLARPTHAVEIAPGVRWVAVDDEHRLGELLQLNNTARVLVDDAGRDLMGVAARTPAS